MQAAGADVVYQEAPRMGHSIDPVLLRELPHWIADTLRRAA
jgi:predicted esterase